MTLSTKTGVGLKWGEASSFHDPHILANFQARESDILITTAPKCGTTWMQQILHQIRTKGDTNFHTIDDVVPWLEIQRNNKTPSEINQYFETLNNPRIFKTHCTYQQTPGIGIVNIILSSRDPRDACVSFYHHQMNMTEDACRFSHIKKPESFDAFFENWMTFGAWFRNIASWWPHRNEDKLLWLRYEDMKIDLENTINQILNFLNYSLNEKQKNEVLDYCSFQWMKTHAEKFTHRDMNGNLMSKADSFIRKGSIGDHKVLLNKTQEQQILDRVDKELSSECKKFIGL